MCDLFYLEEYIFSDFRDCLCNKGGGGNVKCTKLQRFMEKLHILETLCIFTHKPV